MAFLTHTKPFSSILEEGFFTCILIGGRTNGTISTIMSSDFS
jgi:hypothetical protein